MTTFSKWYEWISISGGINYRTLEVFSSLGDRAAHLALGSAAWYAEVYYGM